MTELAGRGEGDRLDSLIAELREVAAEREWERFHDPKNLTMALISEAGELVAEYRWVHSDEADIHTDNPEARLRVEGEIADVGISLLQLCDRLGVDLPATIHRKLEVVRQRYPAGLVRGTAGRPAGPRPAVDDPQETP